MKSFVLATLAAVGLHAHALQPAQAVDFLKASAATAFDRPGPPPRNCEPVGSGIEECLFDVECWEDDGQMMSICEKVIVYKPESTEP